MDRGRRFTRFFGSVNHEKLLTLVAQRIADSRVLRLIRAMLKAGSYGKGRLFPSERGTPQGGVVSPLLSNVLLTPFDQEMRRKGYQLTRFADDWVVTCTSAAEARGDRRGPPDSERIGRATSSAENAGGSRSARVRISGVPDPARAATSVASGQDRNWCPVGWPVRVPAREIDPALQGSGTSAYQAMRASEDQGSDRAVEPCFAGLGSLLQACPRPNALQQTRPLDRAAHLVASVQVLAQLWLETAAGAQALRRVWVGAVSQTDSFYCIPATGAFVKA